MCTHAADAPPSALWLLKFLLEELVCLFSMTQREGQLRGAPAVIMHGTDGDSPGTEGDSRPPGAGEGVTAYAVWVAAPHATLVAPMDAAACMGGWASLGMMGTTVWMHL